MIDKNILIISDAWHPQINGVVRTLENTIRVWQNRGHRVTLISPLDYRTVPLLTYPEIQIALPPYHLGDMHTFDAVHIATEAPIGLAARNYAVKHKIPFTTAYHTRFPEYMHEHMLVPTSLTYKYMRWFHRDSQAIMTPTQSMVDLLQDRGFKNVVHWGRGVNSEIFYQRPAPELYVGPRPYFLNVGRVSAEKNLDAFLSLDLPGTKIIVGDGPQRAHLEEKYPNAVFVGALSGEPLADWYNRADVFVFPSLSDTFGLVNIEAIACGCPVAGFNVTGPKDIVEQNVTGIVHHDLEIAARGCLFLDKSKVVRDFSWEAATDQFFNNLCFR